VAEKGQLAYKKVPDTALTPRVAENNTGEASLLDFDDLLWRGRVGSCEAY
jgi:hypothetical protein